MKFEVGEVCVMHGGFAHGAEATILGVGAVTHFGKPKDYRVVIDGYPGPFEDEPGWTCDESSLRKKRPPEEDNYIPESIRDIFKQKQPQGAPA